MDKKMEQLTNLLKETRISKNIALKEINAKTKIRTGVLEALEKGDFSIFESEVYLIGALRNYSEAVGLDPKETIALYKEIREEMQQDKDNSKTKGKRRELNLQAFPLTITVLMVILIIGLAAGAWYTLPRYFSAVSSEREYREEDNLDNKKALDNGEEQLRDDTVENNKDDEANHEEEKEEIRIEHVGTTGNEYQFELYGAEKMEIFLSFSERCWISVEADGEKDLVRGLFEPGMTREIVAEEEVLICFGYPRGAEISVNGVEVEELKDYNSTRWLRISLKSS